MRACVAEWRISRLLLALLRLHLVARQVGFVELGDTGFLGKGYSRPGSLKKYYWDSPKWHESTLRSHSKEVESFVCLILARYILGSTNVYTSGLPYLTFYSQLGLDVKRTLTNKKAARKRLLRQLASSALATGNYSATAATSVTSSTD